MTADARHSAELHPFARLPEQWRALVEELGEPAFRGAQIFRWIQHKGITDPQAMSNLGRALREQLSAQAWTNPLSVTSVRRAPDGTRKLLCGLADGGSVECVLIPMTKQVDADAAAHDDEAIDVEASGSLARVTLCISTQFGCAMGCVFCASGQAGLVRGLGAAEIVMQVQLAKQHLEPGEELRNLVFMGMGEPLHHYEATAQALRVLTHPEGAALSPRRITVSTVGLVPGIRKLGQDFGGKVGLAISLHAPDDATRDRIVPMNRRYPIDALLRALHEYPLPKRRRITIEYTLIDGVNASLGHARRLARLLRGLRVKLNLIPMNPISASSFGPPDQRSVEVFRDVLLEAGYSCFLRTRRGDAVDAACGQLALSSEGLVRLGRATRSPTRSDLATSENSAERPGRS
jgi:23S rRNA (adenine2503-C2)-methyltransferase